MALETLKDVKEIGEFEVGFPVSPVNEHDFEGYETWKISLRKFVIINYSTNTIAFKIQKGPIEEVGVNGCQVDTIIEAAKMIIEGLNKQFPCQENYNAISRLEDALMWSMKRKLDREKRNVEGKSEV